MELRCIAQREGKLLSFLRRELALSSTLTKRLKYQNAYTVNGAHVFTDHTVRVGDEIRVRLEEPTPVYPPEDAPLSILYEDEALIAVDKPAGMMVHPSSARNTGTLANRLTAYYQKTGQACAVHPVSRLDRDTFGVVLLAKNAHIHALLCAAAKDGALQKGYHALTFGAPEADEGIWDAPIARACPPSLLRCVRPDGKPSRTHYAVLRRFADGLSLLRLQPLTGRTHQLRLHCAHFGCPIVGDPQYGDAPSFGLTAQQLCAKTLSLPHPLTGAPLVLRSAQEVWLPE